VPAKGGTPVEVAALPDAVFLNGLALDSAANVLYATDSTLGKVWKIPLSTGTPSVWAQGADFERNATGSSGFGVNGIKVHGGAVWVSNTDKGTILRVPIGKDGAAGTAVTKVTGLSAVDDFSFTGSGDQLLAAQNFVNTVSLVGSDGTHVAVLTSADGLENPTSTAVSGSAVYVASGAYFTHTDPNLVLAKLG
jgi:sugar lactone lactonase YvrE